MHVVGIYTKPQDVAADDVRWLQDQFMTFADVGGPSWVNTAGTPTTLPSVVKVRINALTVRVLGTGPTSNVFPAGVVYCGIIPQYLDLEAAGPSAAFLARLITHPNVHTINGLDLMEHPRVYHSFPLDLGVFSEYMTGMAPADNVGVNGSNLSDSMAAFFIHTPPSAGINFGVTLEVTVEAHCMFNAGLSASDAILSTTHCHHPVGTHSDWQSIIQHGEAIASSAAGAVEGGLAVLGAGAARAAVAARRMAPLAIEDAPLAAYARPATFRRVRAPVLS